MLRKSLFKLVLGIGLLTYMVVSAYANNPSATAEFINTSGQTLGTANVEQGPHGVLVRLHLEGLADEAGFHAIHIHTHGDCSDPGEGFMASGGHLNPDGMEHGLMRPSGPDAGDFPNIYVDENGNVNAELFTNYASLDGSVGARMLDDTGAAFVIHANPDDHYTQPIGGAGPRIACGEVHATSDIK